MSQPVPVAVCASVGMGHMLDGFGSFLARYISIHFPLDTFFPVTLAESFHWSGTNMSMAKAAYIVCNSEIEMRVVNSFIVYMVRVWVSLGYVYC